MPRHPDDGAGQGSAGRLLTSAVSGKEGTGSSLPPAPPFRAPACTPGLYARPALKRRPGRTQGPRTHALIPPRLSLSASSGAENAGLGFMREKSVRLTKALPTAEGMAEPS